MINIIGSNHEATEKTANSVGGNVANELKDENNIAFDGDKVKLPATEFANIQEALEYVRKQENILLEKNRKNKSEALKEIYHVFDLIEEEMKKQNELYKEYSDVYPAFRFSSIEKLKDMLREYEWDISDFLVELAKKRKSMISMDWGWDEEYVRYYQRKYWITGADLEGESLIKAFISELENLENIPRDGWYNSYHSGLIGLLINNIHNIVIKDNKYKKNPFK